MADNYKITITKTSKEWDTIDKRLKELMPDLRIDKKDAKKKTIEEQRKEFNKDIGKLKTERFTRHLNNKISHLLSDYEKCPDCIRKLIPQNTIRRQKVISPVWHESLSRIADELDIPVAYLIDYCIITPLLIEK